MWNSTTLRVQRDTIRAVTLPEACDTIRAAAYTKQMGQMLRRVFVRELVGVGVSPSEQQDRRQFLIGEVVSLVQENRLPGSSVKASFTAFECDGARYIAPSAEFLAATELFSDGEPSCR